MTIIGTMTTYQCDHIGCHQNVTCGEAGKDGTGWQLATEIFRADAVLGRDLCPEHKYPRRRRD